jgi:hypothetical protein
MPFPLTVAVPTVVPPVVQVVGAVVWANTLIVIVPVAPLVALASVELIELAAIGVTAGSVAGAATVWVGLAFATVVFDIVEPQGLAEAPLSVSPP